MGRHLALAVLLALSLPVQAHQDAILKIGADGRIAEIPAPWGPVRVVVSYAAPRHVTSVQVANQRFNVKLSPCVLKYLGGVTAVGASGSWYHEPSVMPPYLTLVFVQQAARNSRMPEQSVSVTFSLADGRVLMGSRAWKPKWRGQQQKVITHAASCSAWRELA